MAPRADPCVPSVTAIYNDHGSDQLLVGYAGGGIVELIMTGPCLHVYADEIDNLCARIKAVAAGDDPEEAC